VQFYLSQEVSGKDKALERLNAQIAQLTELLSLEKLGKLTLDDQVSQLRAGLTAAEGERDRLKGLYDGLAGAGNERAPAAPYELTARRWIPRSSYPSRAQAHDRSAEPADQRRCAANSPRWKPRSTHPRSATRNPRRASPISASA
jgi:hypothetical protein